MTKDEERKLYQEAADEELRRLAAAIRKERTSINSNIIPDHPKRTTTKKEQTIKNPSKN